MSLCNYRQTPVSLNLWKPTDHPTAPSSTRATPVHRRHRTTLGNIGSYPRHIGASPLAARLQPLEVRLYLFPER